MLLLLRIYFEQSHCTAASHSFSFRKSIPSNKGNRNIDHNSKTENALSPVKSELTVNKGDDNNLVTLVHTVSFYRRQQNANVSEIIYYRYLLDSN